VYTSENNWYSWSYGDLEPFSRQTDDLDFKTHFSRCNDEVGNLREELVKAAKSTLDHCDHKPTILFSGGADSELLLRAILEAGGNPRIIIARYENDYNIYDVSYAVTLCSILNVNYQIYDFNLQKFYEEEAERFSELAQIDRPRALPYCKLLEIIDGFPLMGASDLSPMRVKIIDNSVVGLDEDYNKRGTWIMRCWEHDIGWSKFLRAINKPGIAEWFKWTPGLSIAYMKTAWFNDLVNDRIYGKQGSNSSKIVGYREAYNDLIDRKKQTGFEKIDHLVLEFENHLMNKNKKFLYRKSYDRTVKELWFDLTGQEWNS
jgi:hypothetical protein